MAEIDTSPATTVVLISIDGMRPDALALSDTPTIDRLRREGASTLAAQSVMPSVTLPCHTSMLRGVDVTRHGITTDGLPAAREWEGRIIDGAFVDR